MFVISCLVVVSQSVTWAYGKEGNGKLKRTAETETDDGKWAWSRTRRLARAEGREGRPNPG